MYSALESSRYKHIPNLPGVHLTMSALNMLSSSVGVFKPLSARCEPAESAHYSQARYKLKLLASTVLLGARYLQSAQQPI